MTLGEVERALLSQQKAEELRAKQQAVYDYTLADLIGKSMARLYHSSARMPELSEAYPTLFDSEEIQEKKQEQKDELSALRFKLFAQSYNKKFNEEAAKD